MRKRQAGRCRAAHKIQSSHSEDKSWRDTIDSPADLPHHSEFLILHFSFLISPATHLRKSKRKQHPPGGGFASHLSNMLLANDEQGTPTTFPEGPSVKPPLLSAAS